MQVPINRPSASSWFRLRNHDVLCRLIKGNFPDFAAGIIPDAWDRTVTVQPADLLSELDTAGAIANEGNGAVRLVTGEGTLNLSARAEGTGEYAADIPAAIEGEPGRIAIPGSQLRGLVQMFDGPVRLRWTVPAMPMLISEGDDGLYVLMPQIVDWGDNR